MKMRTFGRDQDVVTHLHPPSLEPVQWARQHQFASIVFGNESANNDMDVVMNTLAIADPLY